MKRKLALCFLSAVISLLATHCEGRINLEWPKTATNSKGESVSVSYEKVDCDIEVFAQRYDADNNPVGEKIWVSKESKRQYNDWPFVAISESGSFVVAWTAIDVLYWTDDCDVYCRIYNSDGATGDIFQVTYTPEKNHEAAIAAVVMTPSGYFAICWCQGWFPYDKPPQNNNFWIQQFDPEGRPLNKACCATPTFNRDWMNVFLGFEANEEQISLSYYDENQQPVLFTCEWGQPIDATVKSICRKEKENPGEIVEIMISPTAVDRKYQVFYCDSLQENCWLPLGEPVKALGTRVVVEDDGGVASCPISETKSRFYKVVIP